MSSDDGNDLLPETPEERMGFGIQSFFFFGFAVYAAFHWPPRINAQGAAEVIVKALVLEFILFMIPFGLLGMIWAVATPNWVRVMLQLCFRHLAIVVVLCTTMAVVAMAFVAAGVW